MKKRKSIVLKYIGTSTIIITVILTLCSTVLFLFYKSMLQASMDREVEKITESRRSKGELMSNFVGQLAAEAVMGFDLYTLKQMSKQILADQDFVQITIVNAKGKELLKEGETDKADEAIFFSKEIRTDEEKMGVDMVVGTVNLAMSSKNLIKAREAVKNRTQIGMNRLLLGVIAFTICVNILLALTAWMVLKKVIIRPLHTIKNRMQEIAKGEGDLTGRMEISVHDEIGELADKFNLFLDQLQSMVRQVSESANSASENSKELAQHSNNLDSTSKQILQSSELVSKSTSGVSNAINDISSDAQSVNTSVAAVTAAIEHLSTTLNDISHHCREESQIAAEANTRSIKTKEKMSILEDAAQDIGKIIRVINDIADQINLLALNASIEAASAGDAGRGFAVVASSIKELAKQTSSATQDITTQISNIRTHVTDSSGEIEQISNVIEKVDGISRTISNMVEEQSSTVQDIAGNIHQSNSLAEHIAHAVKKASQDLNQVTDNIVDVNNGIANMTEKITSVKANSDKMKSNSEQVKDLMGRFKV